jgi:hypothetical protein
MFSTARENTLPPYFPSILRDFRPSLPLPYAPEPASIARRTVPAHHPDEEPATASTRGKRARDARTASDRASVHYPRATLHSSSAQDIGNGRARYGNISLPFVSAERGRLSGGSLECQRQIEAPEAVREPHSSSLGASRGPFSGPFFLPGTVTRTTKPPASVPQAW